MKRLQVNSSASKRLVSHNIHPTYNTNSDRFQIKSISFSGAGFLGVYHCGVYDCLLKHGHLLRPFERIPECQEFDRRTLWSPPILTGVSAGALISTAISCGVTPENAMSVCLDVAEQTQRQGGILDVLKPGFSLIDTLERNFVSELKKALGGSGDSKVSTGTGAGAEEDHTDLDYDIDLLMNRIQNGRLLRIGLTDRTKVNLASLKSDLSAYVYVDQYRDIYDIVSAAILSSYIPIGTGPLSLQLAQQSNNLAISRAWERVKTMEQLGFLKHGESSLPVVRSTATTDADSDYETRYIDGGIANICPEIDNQTLIVCPMNGAYGKHCIAPTRDIIDDEELDTVSNPDKDEVKSISNKLFNLTNSVIHISDRVKFGLNRENLLTAYLMARSSESSLLEKRYRDGYDDAHRYLNEHNLLTVFTK